MPGRRPASNIPSKKRTPEALWILWTKVVPKEQMPNPSVIAGRNHPGPIHLHAICTSSAPALAKEGLGVADVTRDLEDNVSDEEYRQHCVVIVADQPEVFIETG